MAWVLGPNQYDDFSAWKIESWHENTQGLYILQDWQREDPSNQQGLEDI